MADYILVRHKIRDFTKWKSVYESNSHKRSAAGLIELNVLQNTNDPNEVVLLFKTNDLTLAKTYIESRELIQIMLKAGVADKPDIYFLKDSN